MEQSAFVADQDIPWEDLGSGQKRKIMAFENSLMLTKVQFEKGSVGALHQHFHAQMGYVASGVFEVEVNGKKAILNAGDVFYATPNVIHGVVCLEPGVLVDAFSPMRQDFLK